MINIAINREQKIIIEITGIGVTVFFCSAVIISSAEVKFLSELFGLSGGSFSVMLSGGRSYSPVLFIINFSGSLEFFRGI